MTNDNIWLDLADQIGRLAEMAAGYREQCEAAGFSPTAAEQMAVQLHQQLIVGALGGVGRKGRT